MSRELFSQAGDNKSPTNLTVTTVDEPSKTRAMFTQFVNHVIVDDCMSAQRAIDKSQDNKKDSERHIYTVLLQVQTK